MVSKLPSFTDFWERNRAKIPELSTNHVPRTFWASLQMFDEDHMPERKNLSFVTQTSYYERLALTEELKKIKQFVIASQSRGSDDAFKRLFHNVSMGFLQDLALEGLDAPHELNDLKSHRMFSMLECFNWSSDDIQCIRCTWHPRVGRPDIGHFHQTDYGAPMLSLGQYIQLKLMARTRTICLFDEQLELACDTQLKKQEFRLIVANTELRAHQDLNETSDADLLMKGICIGQRWKALVQKAGEAILLCGAPLIDHALGRNIPNIVEMGSKEEFDSLCAALDMDMRWVKDHCGKLGNVLEELKGFGSHTRDGRKEKKCLHYGTDLVETYCSCSRCLNPANLLSGELRSLGLGKTAKEIICQLRKDGFLSTSLERHWFSHAIHIVANLIARVPLLSRAEMARVTEGLLSHLGTFHTPPYCGIFFKAIFDNLWF